MGYTEKYDEAVAQLETGAFDRARQLFYDIHVEYHVPLALLRVSQLDFIAGDFESIQFPEILKPEDAWIRLGIYRAAILGLENELQAWLARSDKVGNSKKVRAFLVACGKQNLIRREMEVNLGESQEVLRLEKILKNRQYSRLLEDSMFHQYYS